MRFKKHAAIIAGLLLMLAAPALEQSSDACTRAVYVSPDHQYVLVGRNMDWPGDTKSNLWVLPRGAAGNGLATKNSLTWQAKYGSVVTTAYDFLATDGMNECGLEGGLLWLPETDYGQRDESRPGLCVSLWLQFCLDSFATVDEAVQFFQQREVQILPAMCPTEVHVPVTVHLGLSDKSGDSAVMEYMDGQIQIFRGKEGAIMTNSPTQDKQLAHLKEFQPFGGDRPLPGDNEPENRFVRATYYIDQMGEPHDHRQAVAAILSVMRNTSQPYERREAGDLFTSPTVWRTVADITAERYYFESTMSPSLIWVDLSKIDYTRSQCLDLVGQLDRTGDVTTDFAPATLFRPLLPMAQ